MNDKHDLLPYGAMLSGIGFGNSSTTLGHALSYVFSNEGVPHGYSLSSYLLLHINLINRHIMRDLKKHVKAEI